MPLLQAIAILVSSAAAIFAFINLRASQKRDKRERMNREYRLAEILTIIQKLEAERGLELLHAKEDHDSHMRGIKEGHVSPGKITVGGTARIPARQLTPEEYFAWRVSEIQKEFQRTIHPFVAEQKFLERQLSSG